MLNSLIRRTSSILGHFGRFMGSDEMISRLGYGLIVVCNVQTASSLRNILTLGSIILILHGIIGVGLVVHGLHVCSWLWESGGGSKAWSRSGA